jgi:hypothetical protein
MMKPGIGTYDKFKELFDKAAKEAGKNTSSFPISSPRIRARRTRT